MTYFALVDEPTPDTPPRLTVSSRTGLPKSGSCTRRLATCACPENETLSGWPLTMPLIDTADALEVASPLVVGAEVMVAEVVCAPAGAPASAARTASATGLNNA